MKRTISLLLVAFLLFSLTACGKKANEKEEKTTTAVSESTTLKAVTTQTATEIIETVPAPPESDSEFVRIKDYIPTIRVDLAYASENNFTKQTIYDFEDAYLRYGTVKKLKIAQEKLLEKGYGILIWDAFRPVYAQEKLWEVCPDSTFVANPKTGYSSHSRGNTVDITLVNIKTGKLVEMPTDFDAFGPEADREYSDCTEKAGENARTLEDIMEECGFIPYEKEWWHYSDIESYEVSKDFHPPEKVAETKASTTDVTSDNVVETEIVTKIVVVETVIETIGK
ncbi:MAG: M15 family metallopeptidase [Clostridia bacterium]|nr:M15 family metallopeptidase [Clostridia bacterium]